MSLLTVLSSQQLSNLSSILNNTDWSPDLRLLTYYQTLASYGVDYGNLAAKVVSGTGDGLVADNFLANYANSNDVFIDPTSIKLSLAQADLNAREQNFGQTLTGAQIEAYHKQVFDFYGLSINGWTAEVPYQLGGEDAWNAIVSDGIVGEARVVLGVYNTYLQNDDFVAAMQARSWLKDFLVAGYQTLSNENGLGATSSIQTSVDSNGNLHVYLGPLDTNGVPEQQLVSDPNGNLKQLIEQSSTGKATTNYDDDGSLSSKVIEKTDSSTETLVYDKETQAVIADKTIDPAGISTTQYYDPVSHAWLGTRQMDAKGNLIAQVDANGISQRQFTNVVLNTLADQIITQFLIKNDLPLSLAAEAFAKASIDYLHPANPLNPQDFNADLAGTLASMAGGILGSEEGADLFNTIGLPPQLGSLVGGTLSGVAAQQVAAYIATDFLGIDSATVLNNIGPSILNGSLTTSQFGDLLGGAFLNAGAALAASSLEQLLFTNRVGPGSEIGGAIGAVIGTELIPIPGVGTFVGEFLGSLFGGLFGGHPSVGPNANVAGAWNSSTQKFEQIALGQDNDGPIQAAKSMGDALNAIMTNLVNATGGTVADDQMPMSLIIFQNKYFYAFGNHYAQWYPDVFDTPNAAIEAAAVKWMSSLTIAGGDPYMAYVAKQSTAANLTDFYSDLSAAQAYSAYATDPVSFDVALAAANDPTLFATWQQELARAQAMGLDKLTAPELSALHQYGYLTPENLSQFGAVIGSGSNFLAQGTKDYFVDTGSGITAYHFDSNGLVTSKLALTNGSNAPFTLGSGEKVLGAAQGLAGTGESDLFATDATGTVRLIKFNSQGAETGSTPLTYADGSQFTYLAPTIPAFGTADYSTMWTSTFRALGYAGPFDGSTPESWFQSTFGETLDTADETGMRQLLSHLPNRLPPDAQFLSATPSALGLGLYDVVSQDNAGHIFINEFNSSGQSVQQLKLTYPSGSPFTYVAQEIPPIDSDAYWTLWQNTFRELGYTGNFDDGHSAAAWYQDKYSSYLGATDAIAIQNLLQRLAEQNPHLVGVNRDPSGNGNLDLLVEDNNGHLALSVFSSTGTLVTQQNLSNVDGTAFALPAGSSVLSAGSSFFGHNGRDLMLVDASGQVSMAEFDASGKLLSGTNIPLYVPDGGHFYLPAGSTYLASGYGMADGTDRDLLFRNADGTIQLMTFAPADPVRAVVNHAITNFDGSSFVPAVGAQITVAGKNFLGTGGADLAVIEPNGQLHMVEIDPTGKAIFYNGETDTSLYSADGGHLTLAAGSTFLKQSEGFSSAGHQDLFVLNPDRTVQVIEFDPNNRVLETASSPLYNADGGHFYLPEGASMLYSTSQFLGSGRNDIFWLNPDGTVQVTEFSATDAPRAVSSTPLYLPDGGHFYLPSGATILKDSQGFFSAGHKDLFIGNQDGSVQVLEFSPSDAPRALASTVLTNADGSVFTLPVGASVTGAQQSLLGSGDHDLVIERSDGHTVVYGFTAAGVAIPGAVQELSLGPNDPVVLQSNASIAVTAANSPATILGNGDSITVADNLNPSLLGSDDSVSLGTNDGLTIFKGHGITVNGSGAAIQTGGDVGVSVNGAGNSIASDNGASISTGGNGPFGVTNTAHINYGTAAMADWSRMDVLGGHNAVHAGSYDNLTMAGDGNTSTAGDYSAVTLNGSSSNTVSAGSNGWVTVNGGSNDTVTGGAAETISLTNADHASISAGQGSSVADTGGVNNTLSYSSWGTAWLTSVAGETVNLSNGWVYAYDNVTARIVGSGNAIAANNGDSISIAGNGQWDVNETLTGSKLAVHLDDASSVTVNGHDNALTGGSYDGVVFNGDNNSGSLGTNGFAWVKSGNGNILHASDATVELDGSTHNTSVAGDADNIYANAGASFNLSGSGSGVLGSGITIYLNSDATNVNIQGNDDVVHVRAGATYTLTGTDETIITDNVVTTHDGDTLATYNGVSDILDLPSLAFDSSIAATPVPNGSGGGQIVVTDHGNTVATINVASATNVGGFTARSDGNGGTLIVDPPVDSQGAAYHPDHFQFRSGEFQNAIAHAVGGAPGQVGVNEHGFDFSGLASDVLNHPPPEMPAVQAADLMWDALHGAAAETTSPSEPLTPDHPHQGHGISHWDLHA
ncbi:hypothetical protein [uncultured Bradyrhizobium sp.]|uniref:hypothetical protein n=1 Tax=uncultured Bradyrhizobium sp. TaxID=199684 RepID=UPI0026379A40|nr:hypothetical protein [uncultured Bradyrhizobium sp.]